MTQRCKNCVLPSCEPEIELDEDGVCNICRGQQEETSKESPSNTLLESKLHKLLNKYKKKSEGKYDCLVMCSGGKDSTLALHYIKERYGLEPLAFTFDNGFETEQALANVRNAVEAMDVDWLKFSSEEIKDIFARLIRRKSRASICQVCSIWYMQLTHDIAARYNTQLIVAGWTEGQSLREKEKQREYLPFTKATKKFINWLRQQESRYRNFPRTMAESIKRSRKKIDSRIISPHWYLPARPEEKIPLLKERYGWQAPANSYPRGSTNCLMNYPSVYLSMKHFGYTHYHVEQSKLIRRGAISRREAKERLEFDFGLKKVNEVLSKINCQLNPEKEQDGGN